MQDSLLRRVIENKLHNSEMLGRTEDTVAARTLDSAMVVVQSSWPPARSPTCLLHDENRAISTGLMQSPTHPACLPDRLPDCLTPGTAGRAVHPRWNQRENASRIIDCSDRRRRRTRKYQLDFSQWNSERFKVHPSIGRQTDSLSLSLFLSLAAKYYTFSYFRS